MMPLRIVFLLVIFSPLIVCYTDDSINLLVRPTSDPMSVRRYCVELAKLPNGHFVNITGFGWHHPHLGSPSVNACDVNNLKQSLPSSFSKNTLLILTEHQCKITEQAWNVEYLFRDISLMILSNRSNTNYDLTWNKTLMPVSIPVLVFWQNDFNRMNQFYGNNLSLIEISISYPLHLPKKIRPTVFLMFLPVFLILLAGNSWAADEFKRKISDGQSDHHHHHHSRETSAGRTTVNTNSGTSSLTNHIDDEANQSIVNPNQNSTRRYSTKSTPTNTEPAILSMPYCIIGMILCFAVGWLLLIFYFPKVMIYVLQGMFCIGAFSSLTSCFDRLSYFLPVLRRYRIPSYTLHKPCTCQLGPLNIFTLFAMLLSLTLVIVWYIFRQADWGWILQDILGAAICITVTSVYRLGNMKVITLILLGFFFYDIFFVFVTPYISLFQSSDTNSTAGTRTSTIMTPITNDNALGGNVIRTYRRSARNPSVMEQVALGFGTNGEVVPLLFAVPTYIPEAERDPCITARKSMLGFGDVILPGVLLTFCRLFDIASGHRWPIYYIQSMISYFIGLSLTYLALYLMSTAQPALLYLVPCILLSTIITGLCRGDLKELYSGRRIKSLLNDGKKSRDASFLENNEHSNIDTTNQPADMVVGISDAIGTVTGVENR